MPNPVMFRSVQMSWTSAKEAYYFSIPLIKFLTKVSQKLHYWNRHRPYSTFAKNKLIDNGLRFRKIHHHKRSLFPFEVFLRNCLEIDKNRAIKLLSDWAEKVVSQKSNFKRMFH